MKFTFKNWKRYNELWIEQEPKNKIDFSRKVKINFISDYNFKKVWEYNQRVIEEVEQHNKNLENKIHEEQQKELEEKTIEVLKYNELI